MRKIFSIIIVCILLVSSVNVFAQDREVTVIVNGQVLQTPVPARIVNDRTMLPMRAIFERLGAVVTWIHEDRMIFATKDDTFMAMQIDNYNIAVQKTTSNEKQIVALDVAPFIDNGHTLVPVRAIAETLQAKVEWDQETYTVNIYK